MAVPPRRALDALLLLPLLLLLLAAGGAEAGRLPAAGAPAELKRQAAKPSLDGVFLALDSARALYSAGRWEQEFRAMQAVGINFFAVRPTAAPLAGGGAGCDHVMGRWGLYYPAAGLAPAACFEQVGAGLDTRRPEDSTVGTMLRVAKQLGMRAHFGLAVELPAGGRGRDQGTDAPGAQFATGDRDPRAWHNATAAFPNHSAKWKAYAAVQHSVAAGVWAAFGAEYGGEGGTLAGFYTDVELNNLVGFLDQTADIATRYYEPLAKDIKALSPHLTVWASPYYVGNPIHPPATIMDPALFSQWWKQIFVEAPHFDLLGPQDATGYQGNSFANVSAFLTPLRRISTEMGRAMWSNVELFEAWPPTCRYPDACGRHPGPIERITKQLANEAPHADALIAWEWASCLSPYTNENTTLLYQEYKAYVEG